ncbi:hypothetical protein HDU81_002659 [Chytriomyces hyalinus]|nr:hypothetical protein HDU81_002659 [Chytriomyces hyalinus]
MYRIVRTVELRTCPDTNEELAPKQPTRILVGLIQCCPSGVCFVDGSELSSENLQVIFHTAEDLSQLDGARVAILRWILVHGACSRSLSVFEFCRVSSEWENSLCSFLVSHESLNRSNISASSPRLFRQNTAIRLNESIVQLKTFNSILLSLDSGQVDQASLRKIKRATLLAALVSKTCIFSLKSMRFFVATFQCLTFPTSNITVQVLFEQSSQPRADSFIPCNHITTLYNQLQILQPYLLTNVDAKQIKFLAKPPNPNDPKSNQTRLLTFHPLDSRIYPLDAVSTDSFCKAHGLVGNQKIAWNHEPSKSNPLKSPSASPALIASYTGRITNVLDPLVGKFQLDDKHDFYVTCAPLPPETESLLHIPGVMISIFNVHVIVLESCDLTLDAGNRAVMVACLDTTVDIVDVPGDVFSSNARNIPSLKDRAELRKRWGSFNLMDMVLLDDLYQTILRVQDSILDSPDESIEDPSERIGITTGAFELSKALLRNFPEFKEKAEGSTSTENSKKGDALTGCGETATLNLALMHDSVCQAVLLRYTRMYRISLEMVLQSTGAEANIDLADELFEPKSVVTAFIDSVVDGRHQNASGGYACGVFGLEDLGLTNCFLVGLLESQAGCLWFRDSAMVSSTDGIPLRIVSNEQDSENGEDYDAIELADLRNCVAILKFELVVEVIGWHTNADARRWGGEGGELQEPLVRTYIKCQRSDILFKKLPRATAILATNETKNDGSNGLRNVVLRVDHINIPALSFKIDGYEISGRMYGCGWSISSRDNLTEVELFYDVAVCNLNTESLFIYPFLKAGGFYLLTGVKMASFGGDEFDKLHSLFVQTTPATVITPIRITEKQGNAAGHIDVASTPRPSLNLPQKLLPPAALNSALKSFAVHQLLRSQQNSAPQAQKKLLPELINLKARVLSKQLVKTSPHQLHDRLPAIHLFEQVHVGLGSFDTQFLLTVGDVSGEGSGTMQIYWDARVQVFSAAVIPGAIVQFNKLGLRVAGSGVYGQTVSETWIQILSNDGTDAVSANRQRNTGLNVHTLPRAFLAKFWGRRDGGGGGGAFEFYSIRCCVTHIEEVRVWSECARCRVKSFGFGPGSLCANKCKGADRVVQGNAKCYIEDGSSDALVYLEGIQAVVGLLGIEGGSAGRSRLDDAVIGVNGASDIVYYDAPPWFGEEDMFGKQDADRGGDAIVFAREVIQELAKEVSKVKLFLMAVRETFTAWRKNNNDYSDEEDDFGTGEVEEGAGGIYSNVRIRDLTCRNLKLTDRSTIISVLGPPRLVLQGTCVEKLSALAEARRILALNLLDRNEK